MSFTLPGLLLGSTPRLSRRRMLTAILVSSLGPIVQACGGAATPTPTLVPPSPTAQPPTPTPTPAPPTPTVRPPTPTARPTGPDGVPDTIGIMSSPDYAAQVFLWGSGTSDADLKLAANAGLRWVKQSFEWRYIEPHVKGKLDWGEPDRLVNAASGAGLKMIARVDNQPIWARADKLFPDSAPPDKLSDYTDFLGAVATRYKGRIQAYEIWNEPNLAREWGNQPPDPKAYIKMLRESYKVIKAADPDAIVISAGLAPTTASGAIAMPDVEFLKQMYQAGLKGNVDMVGVHAAGYKAPPELSPDEIAKDPTLNHGEGAAGRIYGFRHVEDLRKVMVDNGDSAHRMAVLEMGWTADTRPSSLYKWHSVTEQEKADYLVRAFQFAQKSWSPWIGVMSVIYISSPTWTTEDEQYYWGITNPDGSVRPAYDALRQMAKP